jgi:PTS system fructose-specific IIC component
MELNLHASTRDELLFELVDLIPGVSRNLEWRAQLHRALVERENLCCTAMGHGVAIPHTRSTIGGVSGQKMIVFGKHREGLQYCLNDPTAVSLFFLLIAPDVYQHLQTLARLTRLLRNEDLRRQLHDASSPDEVIRAISHAELRTFADAA